MFRRTVHVIEFLSLQGGPKSEATNSWPYFRQILTDFPNFFTRRFLGKFAVSCVLKIPPLLANVATLPREALMPENKRLTINDDETEVVAVDRANDFMRCRQVKKAKSFNKLVADLDVDKTVSLLRRGDFAKATDSLRSAKTNRLLTIFS